LRARRAHLPHILVQQILEHRARLLVAGGVRVGEIIGGHGHAGLLRIETGLGCPECGVHCGTSRRKRLTVSGWRLVRTAGRERIALVNECIDRIKLHMLLTVPLSANRFSTTAPRPERSLPPCVSPSPAYRSGATARSW